MATRKRKSNQDKSCDPPWAPSTQAWWEAIEAVLEKHSIDTSGTTKLTEREAWLVKYIHGFTRKGRGKAFPEWAEPPRNLATRTIRYNVLLSVLKMTTGAVETNIESSNVHPMRGYAMDWVDMEPPDNEAFPRSGRPAYEVGGSALGVIMSEGYY